MSVTFSTTQTSPFSGALIEGSFTRNVFFTQTVGVSVPPIESNGQTITFTILSIDVQLLGDSEPITIATTTSNIEFEGTYLSGWEDVFTYVPAGESNRTTTPLQVNLSNLPPGQDLYNLDQDQNYFIFREYEVTVVYVNDETNEETTEVITLTHEVFNDLESIRSFMDNYNYGGAV